MQCFIAAWQAWITPIHCDPDTAFRERTLRAAIPPFFVVNLVEIVVILLAPDIPDGRAVIWGFFILCNLIEAALLLRGRVNAAALMLGVLMVVIIGVSQIRQGYWSGYVVFTISVCLTFAVLAFTRPMTVLFGTAVIIEYVTIAFWQDRAEVPYANPLREADALAAPTLAAVTVAFYLMLVLTLNYYHIREFNHRAQRVRELVNTLEDRVAQRTADLAAANVRLKELAAIKDEFVSNVSHELRTPITNLKLRYHLLTVQPDRLLSHLEVIQRETDRLSHTIDDLLTLSRLDQGSIEFRQSALDLGSLVEQYIADRVSLAERKQIAVHVQVEPEALPVLGNQHMIEQVLSILLTNALNYTPPGGSIRVAMRTRTVDATRWGELSVEDTGPGISPEEQTRLFERFFRGSAAINSGVPGTGLGLAILKEIVDRHQGRIEVQSSGVPGEGARFNILLPSA